MGSDRKLRSKQLCFKKYLQGSKAYPHSWHKSVQSLLD